MSYNYDGLAYAGGAVVQPLAEVAVFRPGGGWLGVEATPGGGDGPAGHGRLAGER